MTRKQSQKSIDALNLVGQPRESGGVHTVYSAAKACGVSPSLVYYHQNKQKANLASSSNEGISGESQ